MTRPLAIAGPTFSQIAADWLAACPLYLETLATGGGSEDEIVEIAMLDCDGKPLLDTRVRPAHPVPLQVSANLGLVDADLADAPTYAELHDRVAALVQGRLCVSYDAARNLRLIEQSAIAARVYPHLLMAESAMDLYVHVRSTWGQEGRTERRPQLARAAQACGLAPSSGPGRAAATAELTRRLLHHIAGRPL